MTPRRLALLTRNLIKACGGLEEAEHACRLSKSQLQRCCDAGAEQWLPLDALAALEAYCGQSVVSAALHEQSPKLSAIRTLMDEAMEAAEAAVDLQRAARVATTDGDLSPRERDDLRQRVIEARSQLADVEQALDAETA